MSTSIEWTDETWNPVRGCSIVSKGCTNCYAMRQAHRFAGTGQPYDGLTQMTRGGPVWTGKVRLVRERLDQPLHWKCPRRIFVNSMSDLFHDDVPWEFIDAVFGVMAVTTRHTYQILTKRPKRMLDYMQLQKVDPIFGFPERISRRATEFLRRGSDNCGPHWPLTNIWLGVSVENQATADERIPLLLQTPAAVRWISSEPLLGPVDLRSWLTRFVPSGVEYGRGLNRTDVGHVERSIDWVVAGGESGPGARPMDIEWARVAIAQCKAAGVPVFMKQLGAYPIDNSRQSSMTIGNDRIHMTKHAAGADPAEWPEDLQVREFPT